jgi:hypothetical protein
MISDDELLLYYYRDGLDAAERARIGAALSEQPELARRMQGLVARLDSAAASPEVPVPTDVQQRWRVALARAAHADEKREIAAPRRFFELRWPAAAAAAFAIVALTLIVQLVMQRPAEQIVEVATPAITPATADASAYERGLKVHLASTEQQLAELDIAKPEDRARLVEAILAQNRIYALAAERAGQPQLARVLRAFSPVLETVAKGGDSSASLAQLSFELRVMQGRLSAGTDSLSNNQSATL